ncbi:hypothetical protein HYDPIDRAFT_170206 [Hydnomerulius pinastri MD-312]|uniref:DUF4604 domain-containing protein n=1 Tax=Hydnomerulius pinastri MD-312 TaxID=994086 RepID=A0A0C9WAW9_9AGAM|nr:hypothetical protein HYDPIDRAFT_170206 [Hydnomerulius pinastri MD-312]
MKKATLNTFAEVLMAWVPCVVVILSGPSVALPSHPFGQGLPTIEDSQKTTTLGQVPNPTNIKAKQTTDLPKPRAKASRGKRFLGKTKDLGSLVPEDDPEDDQDYVRHETRALSESPVLNFILNEEGVEIVGSSPVPAQSRKHKQVLNLLEAEQDDTGKELDAYLMLKQKEKEKKKKKLKGRSKQLKRTSKEKEAQDMDNGSN